jgi:hypothetical protein
VAADAFTRWVAERAEAAPVTIVSDSGFDRSNCAPDGARSAVRIGYAQRRTAAP